VAHYLVQVAYTPQEWAALVKNPQNRTKVLRPVVAKLGGSFETAFFASTSNQSMNVRRLPRTLFGDPSIAHRAEICWLTVSASKHHEFSALQCSGAPMNRP
jgi:hypothetical protein